MDINALKGKLREKEKTYEQCANALDLSVTAFSNKMNGTTRFYVDEANELANLLNLSEKERTKIFLD